MVFKRERSTLDLSPDVIEKLRIISTSRSEKASRVERAKILLVYNDDPNISAIARLFNTNRPKIERCIDKALQIGVLASLDDLPRSGKPPSITPEAKTWLINLACQKPKELGYSFELWTNRLLVEHAKKNCIDANHPSLKKINRGTVSKILNKAGVRPHKISYYLEKRDPDFDIKMTQVLHVYKEVDLIKESNIKKRTMTVVSYDEKPGIQAIANIAPDLPPEPGKHSTYGRDYEYKRLGTVSFLAGIDLFSGQVHGMVQDRHRSKEFVEYLKMLDKFYPKRLIIRIILDNHSAHVSKETREYLKNKTKRFEFIFTPTHGSWLNIVECLFSKMTRTFLRGIRVSSKKELVDRIMLWLEEINESPIIFKWKYGLKDIIS